jgi:hypothetical protein
MKHRIFALLLAAVMLMGTIPAMATETDETTEPTQPGRAPDYCGEAIIWSFDDGTLTLTGAGAMDDFPDGAPWAEYKDRIEKVVISGGITYIGAFSFSDYDKLAEIEFGKDVYEIGERAFFSCDGLTSISLPESFKIFGPSSFMGCTKLKEIHCAGRFPSFKLNCLWDTWCTIYFPANRPWGVEYIAQLEEAFHGRIEFLASDGTDPYEPTEPTEETEKPTEAPTEPPSTTVPPTTQPPVTDAPTDAPTEAPTEPAPAESEAAPEEKPDPFQPSEDPGEPEKKGGSKIGFLIIGAVGIFLVLGSIVFGGGRKKGRYSR